MRIVFMGTPEFGVPVLRGLLAAGHEVVAVVTQPDRPAGRGGRAHAPPVKLAALDLGLPVLQPETLRQADVLEQLRSLTPDVIVVAAFGQLLPRAVLDLPPHGAINVHASLLPKYRGAAPIGAAILAGEKETGVTVMLMVPRLDAGDMLAQRREPIREDDTTETLSRRLAVLGAELLAETLPRWVAGELKPLPQDESAATYVPMLRREQGEVDWTQPAERIARQSRAYYPWPGCFTHCDGRLLKLLEVRALPSATAGARPGEVLSGRSSGEFLVATGKGVLRVLRVQPQGRRSMTAEEFLRGHHGLVGALLMSE